MNSTQRRATLRKEQAIRLKDQGKEPKEIAAALRVDPATVYGYLNNGKYSQQETFRRHMNTATASVEEAIELGVKLKMGVVTHAGLLAAAEGLRAARHGEELTKRARFNGGGEL